jgi:protein MpaA
MWSLSGYRGLMGRFHGVTLAGLALCGSLTLPPSDRAPVGEPVERLQRREVIGRSVQGRSIRVLKVGSRSADHRVLVFGCIHGTECAGRRIVSRLRKGGRVDGARLWLVRNLNPDGSRAGTRQNARGVDLNRNFARGWRAGGEPWDRYYPGPRPFSEPETRAARRLVRDIRPHITIWYHQAMNLVVKAPRHRVVQRRYARLTGLDVVDLGFIPGTAPRWQNHRWPRHLAMVVELSGQVSRAEVTRHTRAVRRIARRGLSRS